MLEQTIVLGVTGSIAAYKALDVASKLVQAGFAVRVVMTENAARFVTPLSFESLTHHPVLTNLWTEQPDMNISHIRLAHAASAIAVVPATANILAASAHGLAADALTSLLLAASCPVLYAPAMNSSMWSHAATQNNARILRERGAMFVGPTSGYLAEGTTGAGRLADPGTIVTAIQQLLAPRSSLAGKRLVVTAGPTREAIDPVRYLSNNSSGKMGYAIADAAARRGAEVALISGPSSLEPPAGVRLTRVVSTEQLFAAVQEQVTPGCTLVMAAAVADYRPAEQSALKLRRSASDRQLRLVPTLDILASLRRPEGMRLVAFAAETDALLEHATAKLIAKGADLLVANDVLAPGSGFDVDTNHIWLCRPNHPPEEIPPASKRELAEVILDAAFA
jgi:phosphopantothenoylcysteine decarboxylase/phosphopantothenate--cysteine ligase